MDPKIVKQTQDSLGKIIKKPPLTDKLLAKPPFRFLHDITTSVVKSTGFMKGLHEDSELNSENVKDKDSKIAFLQKVIDMVCVVTGKNLTVRPGKIVAGHEPEKTNELLQALAQAINKKVDNDEIVRKVLNKDIKQEEKKDREKEKSEKKKRSEKDEDKVEDKKHREKSRDREKDGEKQDREKRDKSKHRKDREEREDRHKDKDERRKDREDRHRDKDKEERHKEKDKDKDRDEKHRDRKDRKKSSEYFSMDEDEHVQIPPENTPEDSQSSMETLEDVPVIRKRSDRPKAARYRTERHAVNTGYESPASREATPSKGSLSDEKRMKGTKSRIGNRIGSDANITVDRPRVETSQLERNRRSMPVDDDSDFQLVPRRKHSRKKEEESKEKESAEGNEDKDDRIPRPSSAKGSRRRKDGRRAADSDEEEEKKGDVSHQPESSFKETDLPPQVVNARQARPSSARPAPPRPKEGAETEPSMRLGTGKPANLIVDDDKESDDDNFLVEDSGLPPPEPEQPPPKQDDVDNEDHGGLVKKMLESKKEIEEKENQSPQRKVNIERSAMNDATRRKQREQVKKEIDKLRSSIQSLTRSANPLGKIMDYVQEDLDSMQKELEKWKGENKEHALALKREKSVTDRAIEPLQAQLDELDQAIRDQLDASATVKSNIIKNDQKIEKILKSIARS